MIDFINTITNTIVVTVNFFVSLFQGLLTLVNLAMSYIDNIFLFVDFVPSFVYPYAGLFLFISIIFFFVNRRPN